MGVNQISPCKPIDTTCLSIYQNALGANSYNGQLIFSEREREKREIVYVNSFSAEESC